MADSFISDLQGAVNLFNQGTQKLALNAGINNAQKQIADINTQQMNEIQKRQAMENVAKSLTLDLTKSGQSASAIQQAFGAIAPNPINNSNQANMESLMTGSPELANVAQKQQGFEEAPTLAKLKGQQENELALQKLRNQGAIEAAGTRQGASELKAQSKALDDAQRLLESARGNPAVAQAEKDLYAASKADSLANLYGDPNKLSSAQVTLFSQEIAKIAAGGVPTQHELEGIDQKTLMRMGSEKVSKFTNNPTPANAAAFVKQFQDYTRALKKDAQKTIEDKYGRIIEGKKGQLGADNYKVLKEQYIDRFKAPADAPEATAQAQSPAPTPMQTVTLKDGRRVKGRYLPDGRFQVEP